MILYEIFPNKTLKILEDEKTYITENLISSVHIKLPSTFGDYPVKELTAELRFYFPEGNYMAYTVDTQQARPEVPITNDITEKPQTLSVMLFFYKVGNVIGKTNSVDKVILDAPLKGEPLTPRAEFDEVIAEQRETIAEQAETITEQAGTISSQGEQITELSGEVTELTTENTRLENQHDADQNTIQHLIENPPEARLQPKSVTPTASMQVVEPDSDYQGLSTVTVGAVTPPRLQSKQVAPSESTTYVTADSDYDGLSSVTVDNVTASIDPNIQPENIKKDVVIVGVEGTYDPFPEHSVGGIYITEVDEEGYPVKFLVKNLTKTAIPFPIVYQNVSIAKTRIKQFIFENCVDIDYMAVNNAVSGYFDGMTNINKIELPENILRLDSYMFLNCFFLKQINIPATVSTLSGFAFQNCTSLTDINLPNSLTTIGNNAFNSCSSLTNLTLAQGFNCNNLDVHWSTRFTAETIVACLEALADRTGQTAYTITLGTTNLNKLTAEQKAIAINKNWNLA